MKERFCALYKEMSTSKDVSQMLVFGGAFRTMFDKVADVAPDVALATLDALGAIEYHNYLTMEEAHEIVSHLVNDDASPAPRWKAEDVKGFLTAKGLPLEDKPFYNFAALWVTMNMLYSDYVEPMSDLLGTSDNAKLAEAFYKLSIKKLKDADRPRFIRTYFGLE